MLPLLLPLPLLLRHSLLAAVCGIQLGQHGIDALLDLGECRPLLRVGRHALPRHVLQQQGGAYTHSATLASNSRQSSSV